MKVRPRRLRFGDKVLVRCSCGKPDCVAPPPDGVRGEIYDEPAHYSHRVFVELPRGQHPNHTDDCSCVFEVKSTDVTSLP